MKTSSSQARIYQPNLMCKYHLTSTPDNRIKVLTASNNDENVGICDEQIVESLWAWVKEYTARLRENNLDNLPRVIPEMDAFLTLSKNFSTYSVVVTVLDDGIIEDCVLSVGIGNFCIHLAQTLNMKLEGVNDAPDERPHHPR